MHFETPIDGSLNERTAIYRALLEEDGAAAPPGADEETTGDETDADPGPTDYACLGCGTVTVACKRPRSCPACHRTPGDRRAGDLFQPLD